MARATHEPPRRHLSEPQITALPKELPLTAGRLHFVRRVNAEGKIQIRKEPWPVARSLAGQYVLATLDLRRQERLIYHRRSRRAAAPLLRPYEDEIDEPIKPLLAAYRRRSRRPDRLTII